MGFAPLLGGYCIGLSPPESSFAGVFDIKGPKFGFRTGSGEGLERVRRGSGWGPERVRRGSEGLLAARPEN